MAYPNGSEREDGILLVVDGDDEAGRKLADHFSRRGFRASCTAVGQDALDLAHAGRLRAAIVDVTLRPGESTDLRIFLRTARHTLSETWTSSWTAPAAPAGTAAPAAAP